MVLEYQGKADTIWFGLVWFGPSPGGGGGEGQDEEEVGPVWGPGHHKLWGSTMNQVMPMVDTSSWMSWQPARWPMRRAPQVSTAGTGRPRRGQSRGAKEAAGHSKPEGGDAAAPQQAAPGGGGGQAAEQNHERTLQLEERMREEREGQWAAMVSGWTLLRKGNILLG